MTVVSMQNGAQSAKCWTFKNGEALSIVVYYQRGEIKERYWVYTSADISTVVSPHLRFIGKSMVTPVVIGAMSLAVMSLGIVMDWTCVQCCCLYVVLTCSCLLVGPLIMILINIALSPKHQTGSGTVKTVAEVDAFHNMLMVRSDTQCMDVTVRSLLLFIPDRWPFRKDTSPSQLTLESTRVILLSSLVWWTAPCRIF